MDLTFIFNHIGYVICFWGVWKTLDVMWNLLRMDLFINSLLGRDSDFERQLAGKLSYFNKIRAQDDKKIQDMVRAMSSSIESLSRKLTPEMDGNLRSTVYGLHERLKLATDGLKFDQELTKEVEKLRKKVHDLVKELDGPPPVAMPMVEMPAVEPKKAEKKRATKKKSLKPPTPKQIAQAVLGAPARPNPYLPKSLTQVKGACVPKATPVKVGELGEPIRLSTPQKITLEKIKQEIEEEAEKNSLAKGETQTTI